MHDPMRLPSLSDRPMVALRMPVEIALSQYPIGYRLPSGTRKLETAADLLGLRRLTPRQAGVTHGAAARAALGSGPPGRAGVSSGKPSFPLFGRLAAGYAHGSNAQQSHTEEAS
jgi:hypothetical protein